MSYTTEDTGWFFPPIGDQGLLLVGQPRPCALFPTEFLPIGDGALFPGKVIPENEADSSSHQGRLA